MSAPHEVEVQASVASVKGAELDVSKLDPDADGDGNISPLEKEIYAALKAADIDGSGSIGVGELYTVIGNLVSAKRQVKSLGKVIVALLLILVLALASIFVVSVLAGNAIKESKVNGASMTTPDGGSAVRVDTVESNAGLWDLPSVDTATLAKHANTAFEPPPFRTSAEADEPTSRPPFDCAWLFRCRARAGCGTSCSTRTSPTTGTSAAGPRPPLRWRASTRLRTTFAPSGPLRAPR